MNKQSTVKTALSFVLVLVLIIGAIFGLEMPYDAEDVLPTDEAPKPTEAPVVDETQEDNDNVVQAPVEDDENTADEGVTDEAPQDSTPTDEETEDVDNSADTTVAETTEDETTATEGDVENA